MDNLIVVEGVDGSGKTTLARHLADRFKRVYVNSRQIPPSLDQIEEFSRGVQAFSYRCPLILDRHPAISEQIYGPICRNTREPFPDMQDYRKFLRRHITTLIFCRPHVSTIITGAAEQPQMEGVERNHESLIVAYDQYLPLYSDTIEHIHYYNYEQPRALEILEKALEFQFD